MDNEKSAYAEIFEISTQLDHIRKDIEIQRDEIIKCESIIKPYQLALHALNNSLTKLIQKKLLLKKKRTNLLNVISANSDSEVEPNLQNIAVKGEMFENSTTESVISYNCYSVNNESHIINRNIQSQDLDAHQIQPNVETSQLKQSKMFNNNDNHNNSISSQLEISKKCENKEKEHCNKLNSSDTLLTTKKHLKRKRSESPSEISKLNAKREIPCILEFKKRILSKILNVKSGLLIAGNKGMIQMRDRQSLQIVRKFIGFENETMTHLVMTNRNNSPVILAGAKEFFIYFNLSNGDIIKTERFGSEITSLKSIDNEIYIGLKSGSFYTFSLSDFSYLQVQKIVGSYVQSNITLKYKGKLVNLMGCQDGRIYLPGSKSSAPFPVIRYSSRNLYDMIFLSGGSYILSYSDMIIYIINRNNLKKKTSHNVQKQIRKVAVNEKNVYVLLSDGKIYVYKIKKGLPSFLNREEFNIFDSTLKDIDVNDDNAFLIGDENVYFWEF